VALDRDVAQALDLDAEHRQDRDDPLGPEERAMLVVGSVIRSPGALDGTPNERSASELGEALQQRGDDRGCGEDRAEVRRLEVELAERETTTPLAIPDMESIQGAMSGFLDSLSEASERGHEALARCMSPLTLTPKTNGPGRFEASGTIDLAKVVASGSSGGRI
jgi:hypothetical protein